MNQVFDGPVMRLTISSFAPSRRVKALFVSLFFTRRDLTPMENFVSVKRLFHAFDALTLLVLVAARTMII